ncbi:MAG: PilZ domain-containing protein [Desulfobacterales bacterium]
MYTIYTDGSNQVSIICTKCKLEQNIDVTKLKGTQKNLKGKCRCGEPYQFNIEFRQRYREDVRLSGEYFIQGIEEKGEIIVRDLSMSGVQFECLNPHHISKNDELKLKFNLDDSKRREIRKSVKVIWVGDRTVGAHFIETKLYKKELGSYLHIL